MSKEEALKIWDKFINSKLIFANYSYGSMFLSFYYFNGGSCIRSTGIDITPSLRININGDSFDITEEEWKKCKTQFDSKIESQKNGITFNELLSVL